MSGTAPGFTNRPPSSFAVTAPPKLPYIMLSLFLCSGLVRYEATHNSLSFSPLCAEPTHTYIYPHTPTSGSLSSFVSLCLSLSGPRSLLSATRHLPSDLYLSLALSARPRVTSIARLGWCCSTRRNKSMKSMQGRGCCRPTLCWEVPSNQVYGARRRGGPTGLWAVSNKCSIRASFQMK